MVWRFPKNLKIELPYNPAILPLGMYLKEMKTLTWKDICTPMSIAAFFTQAKIQKQPKCSSMDEWIKKMCIHTHTYTHTYVYTHICVHPHTYETILFSHKKEGNLAICDNVCRHWGHYAKWNKSDRERQIPYNLTYLWSLKSNEQK